MQRYTNSHLQTHSSSFIVNIENSLTDLLINLEEDLTNDTSMNYTFIADDKLRNSMLTLYEELMNTKIDMDHDASN